MRILVTVASKHGSTGEIGEIVAGVLRDAGAEVVSTPPETGAHVREYDAVIIGSAVYAGRWLGPARDFVERHEAELAERPVWLFSSGPIGDPPLPAGDAPEGAAIASRIGARDHRTFTGRLERARLGLLERTVTRALHAPDGDFRDLDAVRAWADGIVAVLRTSATPA
jgi:menaquinone-dependent protoporphyrinogen oxidase